MNNTSDQNGRAFESLITSSFILNNSKLKAIGGTELDQARDLLKVTTLDETLSAHLSSAAKKITEWVSSNYLFEKASEITIERLPDSLAKTGDPTDLRIIVDHQIVNLSIKHNHRAVKHQRPSALAQQCGIDKNSNEDIGYRANHKLICNSFIGRATDLDANATKFKELKSIYPNFIVEELYRPVCENVTNFMNSYCNNSERAQHLFEFLVGVTSYIKVILTSDEIIFQKFEEIETCTSVKAEMLDSSHIKLEFSNRWVLIMRLHTASSRIRGVSLKFDTQPESIHVTQEVIDTFGTLPIL